MIEISFILQVIKTLQLFLHNKKEEARMDFSYHWSSSDVRGVHKIPPEVSLQQKQRHIY